MQSLILKKEDLQECMYKKENSISEHKLFNLICEDSEYVDLSELELENMEQVTDYKDCMYCWNYEYDNSECGSCYKLSNFSYCTPEYYQAFKIEPSIYLNDLLKLDELHFDVFKDINNNYYCCFSDFGTNREGLQGATVEELEKIFNIDII